MPCVPTRPRGTPRRLCSAASRWSGQKYLPRRRTTARYASGGRRRLALGWADGHRLLAPTPRRLLRRGGVRWTAAGGGRGAHRDPARPGRARPGAGQAAPRPPPRRGGQAGRGARGARRVRVRGRRLRRRGRRARSRRGTAVAGALPPGRPLRLGDGGTPARGRPRHRRGRAGRPHPLLRGTAPRLPRLGDRSRRRRPSAPRAVGRAPPGARVVGRYGRRPARPGGVRPDATTTRTRPHSTWPRPGPWPRAPTRRASSAGSRRWRRATEG